MTRCPLPSWLPLAALAVGCSSSALPPGPQRCAGDSDCPASAPSCCAALCVGLQTDADNCGSCGLRCSALPGAASGTCLAGRCQLQCQDGRADCNQRPDDGCETSTVDDVNNCGRCSHGCAAMGTQVAVCRGGQCGAGCAIGRGDCDLEAGDGCEIDLTSDVANCGVCRKACALAHATPACRAGSCAIASCDAGYADCDHEPSNGCEAQLAFDPAHCGACGVACPPGQLCVNSTCRPPPRFVGRFNCNDGPPLSPDPPTYTCQEACASLFGQAPKDYSCSITPGKIDHLAHTSTWGVAGCQAAAEDHKLNTDYSCRRDGCSQSAYVHDNCDGFNDCYR